MARSRSKRWRTLLRYSTWLAVSFVVVVGVFLTLMAVPSGVVLHGVPFPLPPPDHDSIVHFFTDDSKSVAVCLGFIAMCAAIIFMQRGQKDRHDPLALIALTLTILGLVMGSSAAVEILYFNGEYRPIGLTSLSILVLVAGGILALISVVSMLARRSPGRVLGLAAYVLVYSPWAVWLMFFVLHPPPQYSIEGGIEVPRLEGTPGHYFAPECGDYELRIDRDGRILRHHEVVWTPESPENDSVLRRELTEMSLEAQPACHMLPEGALLLCADRSAPFGSINRVLSTGVEAGVGIRKVFFVTELARVQQPGTWNLDLLDVSFPRPTEATDAATNLPADSIVEIQRREGPAGEIRPLYRYMGVESFDVGDLREKIWKQYRENRDLGLVFRADVRLPWDAVARGMSAGTTDDWMKSRPQVNGLQALDP